MEGNPNQVLPLERFGGNQVSAKTREKLDGWLKQCFDGGWSDFEIIYDLNRTNGRCHAETGHVFGPLELVAIIRDLCNFPLDSRATEIKAPVAVAPET